MFRIIHPNRYFFWATSLLAIFGILMWGALERFEIDINEDAAYSTQRVTKEPSGSQVPADWKTYRNEKYGFEFRYPSVSSGWHEDLVSDDSLSLESISKYYKSEAYCAHGVGCSFPDAKMLFMKVEKKSMADSLESHAKQNVFIVGESHQGLSDKVFTNLKLNTFLTDELGNASGASNQSGGIQAFIEIDPTTVLHFDAGYQSLPKLFKRYPSVEDAENAKQTEEDIVAMLSKILSTFKFIK